MQCYLSNGIFKKCVMLFVGFCRHYHSQYNSKTCQNKTNPKSNKCARSGVL